MKAFELYNCSNALYPGMSWRGVAPTRAASVDDVLLQVSSPLFASLRRRLCA